jgi:hypothetical protein
MNAQYQHCPKDDILCAYCYKFNGELVCSFGSSYEEGKEHEECKLVKDLKKCPANK